MAQCYHRKLAYLTENGLKFGTPPTSGDYRRVSVPCGKCIACRCNNAAQWATRVLHEAQYCNSGCFVTLTYNPENVPKGYNLVKSDLQAFIKRLRRQLDYHCLGSIRAFLACGEYGSKRGRPHYHLLILGWSPSDLVFFKKSYSGLPIYTSAFLERVWAKGFCPVGTLESGSAAYVGRYTKKAESDNVGNRLPPFFLASRNIPLSNGKQGALGAQWVLDNHKALRLGYLHHPSKPNVKCRIPDYYFDLLEKWFPDEYASLKQYRYDFAVEASDGIFIIDQQGKAVPYFEHEPTEDEYKNLCEKFSVDLLHADELYDIMSAQIQQEEKAQTLRLLKLKRNID